MKFLIFSSFRTHVGRLIATSLAVVLSVAFVVTTILVSLTYNTAMTKAMTESMEKADVSLSFGNEMSEDSTKIMSDVAARVQELPDVEAVAALQSAFSEVRHESRRSNAQIAAAIPGQLQWRSLKEGKWPAAVDEAVVEAPTAKSLEVSIGDSISLDGKNSVRIVGVVERREQMLSMGMNYIEVTQEMFDRIEAPKFTAEAIVRGGDITPEELAGQVKPVVEAAPGGADISVRTRDEAAAHAMKEMLGSGAALLGIFGAFAAVSLLVAGYVISNTFRVLVAQRVKELAMLRCIGADKKQIHGLILGEAGIVASLAAATGCAAGVGITVIAANLLNIESSLTLSPLAIAAGFIIGVVVTVVCAMGASFAATKVRPITALRPIEAVQQNTFPRVRFVLGMVLTVVGGAGLVLGATKAGLLPAIAGGFVCGVGVLILGVIFLPRLVAVVGSLFSRVSTPVELAAANSTKNPMRTAATALSLVIGVGVLVLLTTGINSSRISVINEVNNARPVDASVVTKNPAGFSADELTRIRQLPEVAEMAEVKTAPATLVTADGEQREISAQTMDMNQLRKVVHADKGSLVPASGRVFTGLMPANNTQVTVQGAAGSVVATAEAKDSADPEAIVLANEDFMRVADSATTSQVHLKFTPGLSADDAQNVATNITSMSESYNVSSAAQERAYYNKILNIMLLVVVALLAVTLIISLVGISNTTVLSVLERRRESALLRAVGLERKQLIATIVIEALLTTVVAAACGSTIGILFSWAGLEALGITAKLASMSLYVPWLQVALIIAGAGFASVLAAVLPAVAASRRPPVSDLASTP